MSIIENYSVYGFFQEFNKSSYLSNYNIGFIHVSDIAQQQTDDEIKDVILKSSKIVVILLQTRHCVHLFTERVVPHLNKPYVVVSGMEDYIFPSEIIEPIENIYNEISSNINISTSLNTNYMRHWFAVNKEPPDSAFITSIPYGLDYWTLTKRKIWANTPIQTVNEQDAFMTKLRKSIVPFTQRLPIIYSNYQFNMFGNSTIERHAALETIPDELTDREEFVINRYETWGKYTQYAFVASPRGNGYDTIRTWEALMLGCIVIIHKYEHAGMNLLFDNLPVLIVEQWTDITRELLDQTIIDFSKREFQYEKLTMKYWIDKVYQAFER